MQTHVLEPRPLILLGDCWPPVVEAWQRNLAVSNADVDILRFAQSPEAAVEIIVKESANVSVDESTAAQA
jgi:hypothetical protein